MDRVAVITGASRGIGAFLTLALASRGINVIAIARQSASLDKIKSNYPDKVDIITADLTLDVGRSHVVDIISKYPHIHFLVHNAGVVTPIAPISQLEEQSIRNILETNLLSPILLTNQLLSHMSKKSRILNITSVAGHKPVTGLGPYCISKAGINMLTQLQRHELEEYEIFSASVIPGEVDTSMQKDLRDAPINDFPLATEFQEAKDSNTLIPVEMCASFLAWLLLDTSEDEYSSKEWNIYDELHHQFWLKGKLPLPLNKQKLALE